MTLKSSADSDSLLFRPDFSPAMGTGHVMRCMALAQTCLKRGYEVLFALHECPAALRERLHDVGIRTTALAEPFDPGEMAALIGVVAPAAVVVDGYRFGSAYRRVVATLGRPVLAFDDGNLGFALHADIVINSAPHARASQYADIAAGARLLLGPRFAPLRPEFLEPATPCVDGPETGHALVTFGGSDPAGATLPVARALLCALPGDAVLDVVIGPAFSNMQGVERWAAGHPDRVLLHRDTREMATIMRRARVAVSAASSTLLELAKLAVPSVTLVIADNQAGALIPPVRDLFLCLDARADLGSAAQTAALAASELWRDTERRRSQSASLRALEVGIQFSTVCESIGHVIQEKRCSPLP